jgi:hypothetical protein
MRELLQQPSAYGLSVNTAARQHLDAQFEHLRVPFAPISARSATSSSSALAGDHGESTLQG